MSEMLEEIAEQPAALEKIFNTEKKRIPALRRIASRRRLRLIVLAARGTSDNAALFGRYLLELTTGIPVSLAAPSLHTVYRARAKTNLRDTLVVGLSQSGESTDVNMVLESAKKRGALTVGITNEAGSPMANLADEVFLLDSGRQRSVAATKTYTGQLLIFYLMSAALGTGVKLKEICKIPAIAAECLKLQPRVRQLAERFRKMTRSVVLARGFNYGNAYELALKLMETCYVVAKGFSAADFLHGPIALIEKGFPVILFAAPGKTFKEMASLSSRLNSYGAETVAFTGPGLRLHAGTRTIHVPAKIDEIYAPIPYIIPGQLFAALLAEAKGLDPDHPRALKLVTKTI